jgi:hypothetical protein
LFNDSHSDPPARLADLFERTGFGSAGNVPLPEGWVIDWVHFFKRPWPPFAAQPANKIDARIAQGLFHLPSTQMRAFNMAPTSKSNFSTNPDPPELPLRTLWRGARMGLPSGEQVALEVARRIPGVRIAKEDEIVSGAGGGILTDPKNSLRGNTPLWYYILKEAEALQDGNRLGPVGSWIVGEVIVAALAADPKSFITVAGPEWMPTLWTPELEKPQLEMSKLLGLISADRATKDCSNT